MDRALSCPDLGRFLRLNSRSPRVAVTVRATLRLIVLGESWGRPSLGEPGLIAQWRSPYAQMPPEWSRPEN